ALKQAVEPTQGSRSLVLLAVVDLDDLGAINGRFGRREGDRVLMAFAQQARRSLGSTGIFGRIGGDRFG
ncbi:diguanylate cyclase domain-containing protein, partial [Vibrio parahaemolyticus]